MLTGPRHRGLALFTCSLKCGLRWQPEVKPKPTRFPTEILYTPLNKAPLHSIPSVQRKNYWIQPIPGRLIIRERSNTWAKAWVAPLADKLQYWFIDRMISDVINHSHKILITQASYWVPINLLINQVSLAIVPFCFFKGVYLEELILRLTWWGYKLSCISI